MTKTTTPLYVGPIVVDDWECRGMARVAEHEQGPNPYRHFDRDRTVQLTIEEVREVLADADYQGDRMGPHEFDPRVREAYRRLYRSALKALLTTWPGEPVKAPKPCPNGGPDHIARGMGRKRCHLCALPIDIDVATASLQSLLP